MQLLRYYHTIRHLRPRQVWHRLWRPLQRRFYKACAPAEDAIQAALSWPGQELHILEPHDCYDPATTTFSLLNLTVSYSDTIGWNDSRHGLLWAFHLNYFNWLEDEQLSVDDRRHTIQQYIAADDTLTVGLSSYTISLRSLAWIRFFLKHGAADADAVRQLYRHLHRLRRFPEYELDGNHLWENGCALLAGGLYFKDARLYDKGLVILNETIREQLASDGMHLEASPMYHSLLLYHLLICLELAHKLRPGKALPSFISAAAAAMLGWLEAFAYNDGTWAMVNDATITGAPSLPFIQSLAAALGIVPAQDRPHTHYRVFKNDSLELVADVGNLTPPWQPGHQHADALSFCLQADGLPVIVDAGISAYEPGAHRRFQRSTDAHNTISMNGGSSSDLWKSFRAGRRAQVTVEAETANSIRAAHDGYLPEGVLHVRSILFGVDKIIIEDHLKGFKKQAAKLHLHFHPDIEIKDIGNGSYLARNLRVMFEKAHSVEAETFIFATDFNCTCVAERLAITVTEYTRTTIERLNTSNAD